MLQGKGNYEGKLAFPWGYGCAMTRWQKEKIPNKIADQFYKLFPQDKFFFQEDMLESTINKKDFIGKLHGIIPYQFSNSLTKAQADKVRSHIFPEFIIEQKSLFTDEELPQQTDIVTIAKLK